MSGLTHRSPARRAVTLCYATVMLVGSEVGLLAQTLGIADRRLMVAEKPEVLAVDPDPIPETWHIDNGFLFAPEYLPHGGLLKVVNASLATRRFQPKGVREIDEYIFTVLNNGGVGVVIPNMEPRAWALQNGGYAILSCLLEPSQIESRIIAKDLPSEFNEGNLREWLASTPLPKAATIRARAIVTRWTDTAASNQASARAQARLDTFMYPLTIVAMVLVVIAFGHLLSLQPITTGTGEAINTGLVDLATTKSIVLFTIMGVLDLALTILAHQANAMSEINPVGRYLLSNVLILITFKLTMTGFAASVLFYARSLWIAQKVAWWGCLTMTLLTARWVIFSHIATS